MILTLTPNPALDLTYAVPRLLVGESHRVSLTGTHAGGKGLNVAGVLACMGIDNIAIAAVGEQHRQFFVEDAAQRGLNLRLVDSPARTRRSVTVFGADDRATVLNEQGNPQPDEVWEQIAGIVRTSTRPGDVFTMAGSIPPETADDSLVEVCRAAADAGARLIIDGRGSWVREVLRDVPAFLKPNLSEAAQMTGESDPVAAARALLRDGAWGALISQGANGLVLVTDSGRVIEARPRQVVSGNATGAGDALTAGVAAGLDQIAPEDADWVEILRTGVAWSAAAVRQNIAGVIDKLDVDALIDEVDIAERP